MVFADYLGLVAGGIVTLGIVPQVIRIYQAEKRSRISALCLTLLCFQV
jgi:uncharacterized protein with PQ loop repeat